MRILALVATFAACTFDTSGLGFKASPDGNVVGTDSAPASDGPIQADASPPCPGGALTIDPKNFSKCEIPAPITWNFTPGAWELDTNSLTLTGPSGPISVSANTVRQEVSSNRVGPDLAIFAINQLDIPSGTSIKVTGNRGLVLVSFGGVSVRGTIDASANLQRKGAGANHISGCGIGAGITGIPYAIPSVGIAGSGGGGGGHESRGGRGGKVKDGVASQRAPGGQAFGFHSLQPLVGGCHGGDGGASGAGVGGGGGGIVNIVADTVIAIDGGIFAGGGGGEGGTDEGGGGGGGSGGAILLETTVGITVNGILNATGGGGGEGGHFGGTAQSGQNARPDGTLALGGNTVAESGSGGHGGTTAANPGDGDQATSSSRPRGGGGGGGAAGRIHGTAGWQISNSASVSPTPR